MSSNEEILTKYTRDGYYSPIKVMPPSVALQNRKQFEAEENNGGYDKKEKQLIYKSPNFILPFIDDITRLPTVLKWVQAILGPNLLVFETVFFIKEAHTPHFVSWHQDLTYWGLDKSIEVTAWIALSSANKENGCMQFVPGSHLNSIVGHYDTFAKINMLSRGQIIKEAVREEDAVDIVLDRAKCHCIMGEFFIPLKQTIRRRGGLAWRFVIFLLK